MKVGGRSECGRTQLAWEEGVSVKSESGKKWMDKEVHGGGRRKEGKSGRKSRKMKKEMTD